MNGQNLLNSMIACYFHDSSFNSWIKGSKWKIKHGKDWASMESIDDSLDKAAKKQNWLYIAHCDRYIYKKITNEGMLNIFKWVSFDNGVPIQHELEFNFAYLDPSLNVTPLEAINSYFGFEQYGITKFIHLYYNALIPPLTGDRSMRFGADDYTNLTPLDYPNVDIV